MPHNLHNKKVKKSDVIALTTINLIKKTLYLHMENNYCGYKIIILLQRFHDLQININQWMGLHGMRAWISCAFVSFLHHIIYIHPASLILITIYIFTIHHHLFSLYVNITQWNDVVIRLFDIKIFAHYHWFPFLTQI